jgi:hypothetical protein
VLYGDTSEKETTMAHEMIINEAAPSPSSVQIESRTKGAPQVTIKVYWAGSIEETRYQVEQAALIAAEQYDLLMARYAEAAPIKAVA